MRPASSTKMNSQGLIPLDEGARRAASTSRSIVSGVILSAVNLRMLRRSLSSSNIYVAWTLSGIKLLSGCIVALLPASVKWRVGGGGEKTVFIISITAPGERLLAMLAEIP